MTRKNSALALRTSCIVLALSSAAAIAANTDSLSGRECGNGSCMANVDETTLDPCKGAALVIAWASGGGAMAIECWTQDAPMDQPIFVFDRRRPDAPAYDLTGIRAFKPDSLAGIADPHREAHDATLPSCKPPKPATMAPGELLLTEKVPSPWGGDRDPYCYRVMRVATTAGGIVLHADDGDVPKVSTDVKAWHALAAKMSALAAQSDAQAHAHVTRERAPLRDVPDPKTAPHGYLVAGEAVEVLDRDAPARFVKVLYVSAKGARLERWISQDDIAP